VDHGASDAAAQAAPSADAAEPAAQTASSDVGHVPDAGSRTGTVLDHELDAGASHEASADQEASVSTPVDARTPEHDAASAPAADAGGIPTLFWLDALQGRVVRGDPIARTSMAIVTRGSATPDGVAVDPRAGAVYWTNMGVPSANDGFILRAALDGSSVKNVIAVGDTFTPKQLKLDVVSGELYWSDREGMRVMRAHVDGSQLETLVTTASGQAARADAANWAVGIAVDAVGGKIYWTQKGPDNGGKGSIRRAGLTLPAGQDSATRTDIEILFAGLPEPIDLELDLTQRQIYWTDRGDNTISRAQLDPPSGVAPNARKDREVLVRNAGEAIGIALDLARGTIYYSALDGTVSSAKLDGSEAAPLFRNQGSVTGIAFVELPR
jgi:DNA-binding beta-propeller fold protein YncE